LVEKGKTEVQRDGFDEPADILQENRLIQAVLMAKLVNCFGSDPWVKQMRTEEVPRDRRGQHESHKSQEQRKQEPVGCTSYEKSDHA